MRPCVLLVALLLLPVSALHAMTPAVRVVELAMPGPEGELALCVGLRLSRGEAWLAHPVTEAIRNRGQAPAGWRLQAETGTLESLRLLLLWRDARRCEILASDRTEGRFPEGWLDRASLPWSRWQLATSRFVLQGRQPLVLDGRQGWHGVLPTGQALRLYDHGWLELYAGRAQAPPASPVGVDDAVTLRLEGPGDLARFRFRAPVAGTLIVERTPGTLPGLALRIGRDADALALRGSLDLPAGGEGLIEVRWQGSGPLQLDLGFLFVPDSPLRCRMRVEQLSDGRWQARLVLHNASRQVQWLAAPSAGTVTWLAGGAPVGVARPGRQPERIALAPGEAIRHEQLLQLPPNVIPDGAEVNAGRAGDILICRVEPGSEE